MIKMGDEDKLTLKILLIGIVLGLFFILLFIEMFYPESCFNCKRELGQSICDQEYNMDYNNYHNNKLTCQPKTIKAERQYDGITIQIK